MQSRTRGTKLVSAVAASATAGACLLASSMICGHDGSFELHGPFWFPTVALLFLATWLFAQKIHALHPRPRLLLVIGCVLMCALATSAIWFAHSLEASLPTSGANGQNSP